jgi:hypothetical protein
MDDRPIISPLRDYHLRIATLQSARIYLVRSINKQTPTSINDLMMPAATHHRVPPRLPHENIYRASSNKQAIAALSRTTRSSLDANPRHCPRGQLVQHGGACFVALSAEVSAGTTAASIHCPHALGNPWRPGSRSRPKIPGLHSSP